MDFVTTTFLTDTEYIGNIPTVFVVIGLVAFAVLLLFILMANMNKLNKNISELGLKMENKLDVSANVQNAKSVTSGGIDGQPMELILAIATVLALELGTSPDKLVIRSIKRVPSWNGKVKTEQLRNY